MLKMPLMRWMTRTLMEDMFDATLLVSVLLYLLAVAVVAVVAVVATTVVVEAAMVGAAERKFAETSSAVCALVENSAASRTKAVEVAAGVEAKEGALAPAPTLAKRSQCQRQ